MSGPTTAVAVPGAGPALADLSRRLSVYGLTLLLGVAAAALYGLLIQGRALPFAAPHISWPGLAVMYLAAEAMVIHLSIGRETHTFALTEIPLVLGLFLAAPCDLLTGQAVGAGIALVVVRRQPVRKVGFNLASFAFSTCVAIIAFGIIVDPGNPLGPRGWIAAFTAALVADMVSAVTVQLVIAFSKGEQPDWAGLHSSGVVYVLANASLGLVAVLLLVSRPETAWLAGALTLAMYGAYRVSEREHLKHLRLLGLHDATSDVQETLNREVVTQRLLDRARRMFGSEMAELLVLPANDQPARRTRVSVDGEIRREAGARLDPPEKSWGRTVASGTPVRLTAGRAPEVIRGPLAAEGIRDLMSAPVRGAAGVVAILTVMNREGHVGGWRTEDMTLLETLANHAAIALRNGELVEGLATRAAENEYQAHHDALTGLPNRTWFHALVDAAMATRHPPAALLTLDIDRFKEVNDSLGHENGDRILCDLARRLEGALGPNETVARLGGDEFAMLIMGSPATAAATSAIERVQRCLEEPFAAGDLLLNVTASLGVAMVDDGNQETGALLRHADVAMYRAKATHAPFEFYSSERDEYNAARLALAGELRPALEARHLRAWYQPKVDVASGRIVGAEALVRWLHPMRGLILPDAFIPIVEQTNLLRPMTLFMLESSIGECAGWRAAGMNLSVAVNLSARNLLDLSLPGEVARMLRDAALPGDALTLEITESAMMADPEQSQETLRLLRRLGAHIAIDDFGTGHSSLAYLKRLPVTELKIDREFVMGLDVDEDDRSIVRSTIELAHELGLIAVAEGVETTWIWQWLSAQRCDQVQGRLMSMPVPPDEFENLARRSLRGKDDGPTSEPVRRASRPLKPPPRRLGRPPARL